jgi:hypothetical protein
MTTIRAFCLNCDLCDFNDLYDMIISVYKSSNDLIFTTVNIDRWKTTANKNCLKRKFGIVKSRIDQTIDNYLFANHSRLTETLRAAGVNMIAAISIRNNVYCMQNSRQCSKSQ